VCANDNCPGLDLSFTEVKTQLHPNNSCARYQLNRTWVATDACGLSASTNQIVRVFDTTPPVCVPPILPPSIDCLASLVPPPPDCRDDCSGVTVTRVDGILPGPLNCTESKILTFNWTACDACLNCITFNATVTVDFSSTPIIAPVPDNQVLECNPNTPAISTNGSDACFGEIAAITTVTTFPTACPLVRTDSYTFTIVNPCNISGQTATFNITYVDTLAPEFNVTLPENVTWQCNQIQPPPPVTGLDNCGVASVIFEEHEIEGSCSNAKTIVRTWTLRDCVGNTRNHSQYITVIDTIPP